MSEEQRSQRVVDAEFEVITGPGGTPLLPQRRKFSPLLIMRLMWRVWSVAWIGALALMFVVAIVWHQKPRTEPFDIQAPPPLPAGQHYDHKPLPQTAGDQVAAFVSSHRLWFISGFVLLSYALTGVYQGFQDRARGR